MSRAVDNEREVIAQNPGNQLQPDIMRLIRHRNTCLHNVNALIARMPNNQTVTQLYVNSQRLERFNDVYQEVMAELIMSDTVDWEEGTRSKSRLLSLSLPWKTSQKRLSISKQTP
jgi:hypothetical protein